MIGIITTVTITTTTTNCLNRIIWQIVIVEMGK